MENRPNVASPESAGRRRILVVANYLPPHVGGVETVALRQATLFAELGHDVVLAGAVSPGWTGAAGRGFQMLPLRSSTFVERLLGVPWPLLGPGAVVRLWREARRADLVVVNGYLYFSSWVAQAAAVGCGRRVILVEHAGLAAFRGMGPAVIQRLAAHTLGAYVARRAHAVVAMNPVVASLLRRLQRRSRAVHILPAPIDETLFNTQRRADAPALRRRKGVRDDKIVLYVGRPTHTKGFDRVLGLKRQAGWEVWICGPLDAAAEEIAKRQGFHVFPPRPQQDLADLYREADLVVIPSRSEGALPMVAREAMACGTPVLLGRFPGWQQFERLDLATFADLDAEPLSQAIQSELSRVAVRPTVSSAKEDESGWAARMLQLGLPKYGRGSTNTRSCGASHISKTECQS